MLVHSLGGVVSFCHATFAKSLSKPCRENLGRAIAALCESRDARLSSLARSFNGAEAFRYRLKRVDRFVANPRVFPTHCFAAVIPLILKFADRLSGYLPILVDHTDVGEIRICYAAVLFKKRALPLCFHAFPKKTVPVSQNRIEQNLLTELHRLIPSRIRVVIVADRGFGRVSLFRMITRDFPWSFVIRVKGTVWITHGRERGQLRHRMKVPVREDVIYHKTAKLRLHLVTRWLRGNDDPWFLATNLAAPALVHTIYQRRMRIEELFRDEKFHLGMEVPSSRQLPRFEKLLFVVLLAALLLLLLGRKIARQRCLVQSVIVRPEDAGFLWLALQTLAHGPPRAISRLFQETVQALSAR